MALEPGQIIEGKYRVVRLIGEGGMGTVYEGENKRIGRRVAIKVLHQQVASMPEFVERFEREARAAARIGSPHVCDVLDLGDLPSGDRFIVMEYLEGVSFEDRLVAKGKLSSHKLAPIAFELLEGLGTMHGARVVHRDLKPANVFLARTPSGRGEVVKILDFGVAKLLPFEGEVGTMTQTGSMMGTPLYMSPEQARGARDVDARTDLYAASVMFYRALTGRLPYIADTLNELLFKIVLEDPKPLRELAPEVDEVFAGIVHKGLARDVAQRFQSALEYQEAIAAWGKTQGRTSLAFAVTLSSEPPSALPAPPGEAPAAVAVSAAEPPPKVPTLASSDAGGTPTAWSEDAPDLSKQSSATMRAATDAAAASAQSVTGSTPASAEVPERSVQVTGDPAPPTPTNATTAPSAADIASAAEAREAARRRSLVVRIGAVAAVLGFGAVIFYARGMGSTTKPAGLTETPPSAETTSSASVPPEGAVTPTTASATASGSASAAATTSATASSSVPPTTTATTATAVTAVTASPKPPVVRRPDPPVATAVAATSAAAHSATTAPSAAPAKPAASGRKFRTNLD